MSSPKRGRALATRLRLAVLALTIATITGCSPTYVARAAWEEAKFLWRRAPIEELLREGSLGAEQEEKLRRLLEVRRFAEGEMGLSVGGAYETVSKVDGDAQIHVVTAARRDRLQPVTWWFPIVGRVPYKGFFSEAAAQKLASELKDDGYDTFRRTALAFSTLGWFDDPLPSTLLDRDQLALSNTVLHELFHKTAFVSGHVDFNESAATFVGHRGAIAFFCSGERSVSLCERARRQWEDAKAISGFLESVLEELAKFYATRPQGDELEEGRRRMFASIRGRFAELELHGSRYWNDEVPLNNATLLHDRTYFRSLARFERLFEAHGGSLFDTIVALREIAASGEPPFVSLEQRLAKLARIADQGRVFRIVVAPTSPK